FDAGGRQIIDRAVAGVERTDGSPAFFAGPAPASGSLERAGETTAEPLRPESISVRREDRHARVAKVSNHVRPAAFLATEIHDLDQRAMRENVTRDFLARILAAGEQSRIGGVFGWPAQPAQRRRGAG